MPTPSHVTMMREIAATGDRGRTGVLDLAWDGSRGSLFFLFGHPSHAVFTGSDGRNLAGSDALSALVHELPATFRVAPWRRAMVTEDTLRLTADELLALFPGNAGGAGTSPPAPGHPSHPGFAWGVEDPAASAALVFEDALPEADAVDDRADMEAETHPSPSLATEGLTEAGATPVGEDAGVADTAAVGRVLPDFIAPRLEIDVDALREELNRIAVDWLTADDAPAAITAIAATRPGVADFVSTIAAISTTEFPGHERSVIRAMAREMHFRASEVLCGI